MEQAAELYTHHNIELCITIPMKFWLKAAGIENGARLMLMENRYFFSHNKGGDLGAGNVYRF